MLNQWNQRRTATRCKTLDPVTLKANKIMTEINQIHPADLPKMQYSIESKEMQKWDSRLCDLARYISFWSKDPNAKVGAVLFSKKGGNISIGYNGFPIGVEDSAERLTDKDVKLELVVHAEVNAIIAAGTNAAGSTIYVWGKPICARCAGPIIQAGIKRVVALAPGDTDSQWDKSGKTARDMFIEAGITVDFYTPKEFNEAASTSDLASENEPTEELDVRTLHEAVDWLELNPPKTEEEARKFLSTFPESTQSQIIAAAYIGRDHIHSKKFNVGATISKMATDHIDHASYPRILYQMEGNLPTYMQSLKRCASEQNFDITLI